MKKIEALIQPFKLDETGNIGDGKSFISDVAQAFRIRTSEEGADAR